MSCSPLSPTATARLMHRADYRAGYAPRSALAGRVIDYVNSMIKISISGPKNTYNSLVAANTKAISRFSSSLKVAAARCYVFEPPERLYLR